MARTAAVGFLITSILWCGSALAQRGNTPDQPKTAAPAGQENQKPSQHDNNIEPYRLDFSLIELEDGKKINTRRYSMNLTAGNNDEIRIGTRVPVLTGPPPTPGSNVASTQVQYMDVGTRIWANLRQRGDSVELQVRSEISNLDTPDAHDRSTVRLPPIVRSINISGSTLLVTAKPIVIGSTDDPNSNRQFQLEVTATKVR